MQDDLVAMGVPLKPLGIASSGGLFACHICLHSSTEREIVALSSITVFLLRST